MNNFMAEYLCGMIAGILSVLVTFPVNKLMFRQSAWGVDIVTALRQLKIEGYEYLYRGVGPPLLIKPLTSSIMFGSYNQYYKMLSSNNDYHIRLAMTAAMLSGSTEALFATPFERIQVILQDGRLNNRYMNMFDAFYQLRRYGLQEYYRGFNVTLLRNGPSTFLYFSCLYYSEKIFELDLDLKKKFTWKFFTGAILGSTISTLVYPLNVIRTRIQIQPIGTKHMTIKKALEELFEERIGSRRSLVAGIQVNMFRSFLHWGSITAISDLIRNKINNMDKSV